MKYFNFCNTFLWLTNESFVQSCRYINNSKVVKNMTYKESIITLLLLNIIINMKDNKSCRLTIQKQEHILYYNEI